MSLVVRRLGGVLSQPTTGTAGTTIFTDAFTGTNGAAWGANWTTGYTGTNGAAATIDTNRGKMVTGATGGYASTDRVTRRYTATIGDFDAVVTWTATAASEIYPSVAFRSDQASLDIGTGYYLELQAGALTLTKVVGYGYSTAGTAAKTHTLGTSYKVRVVANGSSIRARSWLASGSEPSTWDIDVTDTAATTGYFGLIASGSGAAASQTMYWDDITVTTIGTGGGATGGGTTGGTGTGGGGTGGGNTSTARAILWHGGWRGPRLRNYPSDVKSNITDVCLGMGQGGGSGSFSYSVFGQSASINGDDAVSAAADVRSFITAGINVALGVGGSGGGVRVLNQTQADQFVASTKAAVSQFGINGINLDIESNEWDQIYLANVCQQLRTYYGANFQIQVTTSMYEPLETKWMNFLNYLGHANYTWTGPMLYDFPESMDSRLTAVSVQKADRMIGAGVPQNKMVFGYMLQPYPGYSASPNVGVINTAYAAVKAKYPSAGGMYYWVDDNEPARNWEWSRGRVL